MMVLANTRRGSHIRNLIIRHAVAHSFGALRANGRSSPPRLSGPERLRNLFRRPRGHFYQVRPDAGATSRTFSHSSTANALFNLLDRCAPSTIHRSSGSSSRKREDAAEIFDYLDRDAGHAKWPGALWAPRRRKVAVKVQTAQRGTDLPGHPIDDCTVNLIKHLA